MPLHETEAAFFLYHRMQKSCRRQVFSMYIRYEAPKAAAGFQVGIINRFWFRHSLGARPYIFLNAREK